MDSPENVVQSVVNQMSFTPSYSHFCLLISQLGGKLIAETDGVGSPLFTNMNFLELHFKSRVKKKVIISSRNKDGYRDHKMNSLNRGNRDNCTQMENCSNHNPYHPCMVYLPSFEHRFF